MKKTKLILAIVPLICILLITCAKRDEVFNTQLLITVKDTAGDAVEGATVRLYQNAADIGVTKITGADGKVLFSDLVGDRYYWTAEKGCLSNRNKGQVTHPRPLVYGTVTYGNSTLNESGTLIISNISAEPYLVSDSLFSKILNDTPYISYPEIGIYLIRHEKVSTPGVGKDSLVQISCGDTTYLTIPY